MKNLWITVIVLVFLLFTSQAFGYTASKFVSDYGDQLSEGQKIKVLVKVKGEPESLNPAIRAKEVRYLQSAVLKFINFAGATNVKSDTWNNEFTAIVTASLAKVLEKRSDVISVQIIETATAQTEPPDRNMIYDLVPNINVKIVDLKIIPVDDKPKDPFDDSDVILITFEITNRGIDYFVLSDKMFKILVMEPSFPFGTSKPQTSFITENYSTLYDAELETKYDDYPHLEIFDDCEYLHDRIFVNQTETYSICFDVPRKWDNTVLNINGPEYYFLTLMDSKHNNSCPNCVENLLSIETKMPQWFENNLRWYDEGKISEDELENAIKYLQRMN